MENAHEGMRRYAELPHPQAAEPFYARTVVLVEGVSDKLAKRPRHDLSLSKTRLN